VIVNESPEFAVAKTISSLVVSGSIASVNWSTLPADSVTPPRRPEPVPVATVIVVPVAPILDASVVATLIDENLRVAIALP
jgi:hypothetical protein